MPKSSSTHRRNDTLDDTAYSRPFSAAIIEGMGAVDPRRWDALCTSDQPFSRHAWFAALERHGCAAPATGWTPHHVLLEDAGERLVGALPLYLKDHSWGEFVFDFSWAQAYAENGLDYYPKLLGMSPFTPVTGQRLLAADRNPAVLREVIRAAIAAARRLDTSSLHILYPAADELAVLESEGLLRRDDCRFLWRNHGYGSFDDFLGALRAGRRKDIRRERRRVAEQGIVVTTHVAAELDAAAWRAVYAVTARTFLRRGNRPYLNLACLLALAQSFGEQMLVNVARRANEIVGAAILFRDRDTLYGRYWGASAEFDCLHFETCYYRGIEFCIEHGLQSFDPGTQGEHKVRRGFAPVATHSAHWIRDPRFRSAIARYLEQERADTEQYMRLVAAHLPYRRAPA